MAELQLREFNVVCVEPEGEWCYEILPAKVLTSKHLIAADGTDMATITAQVNPVLSDVTFYHADSGEAIATVPVDPETHMAILQMAATTPGAIRIRAGEPTMTRLNEVIIHAVEAS